MGTRWILAVTSCLLVLSGCGIGRTTVRPEIYGQFEIVAPIIFDTMTGLEWQVGPDRNTNWYEAKEWVDGLGGNWRMPTRAELRGLWDAGISRRNWGPFENNGWNVWSGEVYDSSSVWYFSFYPGSANWYRRSGSLNGAARAFAVRPRTGSSPPQTPADFGSNEGRVTVVNRNNLRLIIPVASPSRDRIEHADRFSVSGEVITDRLTGLEWQVGPDREMTWDEAKEWADGLGGNWRMPSMAELRGLWNAGIDEKNWGPFQNRGGGIWIWSGEVIDSSSAWRFVFRYGEQHCIELIRYRYGRAFAVCSPLEATSSLPIETDQGSMEIQTERFTVSGEAISDSVTGLQWRVGPYRVTWYDAIEWIESLGGDWRMPTRDDLQGLWDAGIRCSNWGPFENRGMWVWSGELRDTTYAWIFLFNGGYQNWYGRCDYRYVNLCAFAVRSRTEVSPSQIPRDAQTREACESRESVEGRIFGRVESNEGVPLIGATVMALGTTWGTMTGYDGLYTIRLPAGNYTLFAHLLGMGERTSPVLEVLSGDEIEFDFTADNPNPEDPIGYSLYFIQEYSPFAQNTELMTDRFLVSEGVVFDPVRCLEWRVGPDLFTDWYEAMAWVDGLGADWRMPTHEELQGLWDAGISVDNWGPFDNSGYRIWSEPVHCPSSARYFNFFLGDGYALSRRSSLNLRAFAVRSR